MKSVIQKTALGGLLALAAAAASAEVSVNYVQQERFTDLPLSAWEREAVLKEMTRHFAKLAEQLPPGQNLRVEVTDLDLAGRKFPGIGARDLRVANNVDWPRIEMRYAVESNGEVLRSGDVQLRDMNFKNRRGRYSDGDTLRYEKRMLDDWFRSSVMPAERTAMR